MRTTLLLALLHAVHAAPAGPILHIDDGPIQGKRSDKLAVSEFHGVPYAAPPVGELRWRTPERPTQWNATLQTTKPVSVCPQVDINSGIHLGAEDCLYLSIYVPDGCSKEKKCPVMQWIHGGAWIFGSNYQLGSYDGSVLANEHQVIIVGGNYRLDSLGWLALAELAEESEDGSYGNYGLKDQQAVLKWIHRNADVIGGDTDRITMWGQSAGGFSVCQHLVSPGSNGLFSRAIMESGTCDGPWLIQDGESAKIWSDNVAKRSMGCPTLVGKERMKCLRALPLSAVATQLNASWLCLNENMWNGTDPWCDLRPATHRPPLGVIGGWSAVVDGKMLPDVPVNLIANGQVNKGPRGQDLSVIVGTNTDDYALFEALLPLIIPGVHIPFKTHDLSLVISHMVPFHKNWNHGVVKTLFDLYNTTEFRHDAARISAYGTDMIFRCGARAAAKAMAQAGVSTYLYQFDYRPSERTTDSDSCQLTSEVGCGVRHGDELAYVYGKKGGWLHPEEEKVSKYMGALWTQFATTGVPGAWPLYNASEDRLFRLDATPVAVAHSQPRCDVWASLPKEGPYV